jgi:CRP/FNR family transcriptional regulator
MLSSDLISNQLRNTFEKALIEELLETGKLMEVKAGETIIDNGQYIKFIPILISGNIKIIRQDDVEGEILLYYVGSNETCAMSLTCCMAHQKSRIRAVAEDDTKMITIPIAKTEEWMVKYPSWKNFVMQTYSARFDELLKTIDSIAFHKVDERLVKYLRDKSQVNGSNTLNVSHQQIAEELNSSREVISRLLKQLEHNGAISLGRNKIEILKVN